MRRLLTWIVSLLAPALLIATLVSLVHSDVWWIQALGFPRVAMLLLIGVVALAAIAMRGRWRLALFAMLIVAASLQFWRIYPYTRFASVEVGKARSLSGTRDPSCFTVLGLNVLQHNRDYAATRALIDREQPDILLLMETDRPWVDALTPTLAPYPAQLLRPIGNTYGLVFATRLPVVSVRTENITDRDTPTVYARLTSRGGQPFDYVGLHPRPPVPGQNTTLRDRKIEHAALRLLGGHLPAMAMGDFNDVAWSPTTRLSKQIGGFLDPRIGRGSYPTFPASAAPIGWPLDQMFLSPGFTFRSLRVLENVGSDHRPLAAELCLEATAAVLGRNAAPDRVTDAARHAARAMTER
jgi:endonuclease/exonuclease/phosphatase (EEP) superfamily protein YafD